MRSRLIRGRNPAVEDGARQDLKPSIETCPLPETNFFRQVFMPRSLYLHSYVYWTA